MMICTTDTKGRTVWVSHRREDFDSHLAGFRERNERYRIVERGVSALGGTSTLFVLVLLGYQ
jgi:hypothetical protein